MAKASGQHAHEVYVGPPMFDDLGLEPQLINPAPAATAGTGAAFRSDAVAALRQLAAVRREITVDDLYAVMPSMPPHYNAMGSVWADAMAAGIVADTGRQVRTKRKEAHGRKVPVYRSLLVGTVPSCNGVPADPA